MTTKVCRKLESAWRTIFDFIIPSGLINRYGIKRLMKCTMPQRNRDENGKVARAPTCMRAPARTRAHGGSPVLPSTFGCEGLFGSNRGTRTIRERGIADK